MPSNPTVDIRPSNSLFRLVLLLHGVVLVVVLLNSLPAWYQVVSVFFILISCLYCLSVHYFRASTQSVKRFRWVIDHWYLECNDGGCKATLLPDSVLSDHLLVLHFKLMDSGKHRYLMLFNDAADRGELRQLRVFLRMIMPQLRAKLY